METAVLVKRKEKKVTKKDIAKLVQRYESEDAAEVKRLQSELQRVMVEFNGVEAEDYDSEFFQSLLNAMIAAENYVIDFTAMATLYRDISKAALMCDAIPLAAQYAKGFHLASKRFNITADTTESLRLYHAVCVAASDFVTAKELEDALGKTVSAVSMLDENAMFRKVATKECSTKFDTAFSSVEGPETYFHIINKKLGINLKKRRMIYRKYCEEKQMAS